MYLLKKILMATVVVFIISQVFVQGTVLITGCVISAVCGQPIAGAIVTLPDKNVESVTDAAGRFAIAAKTGDIIWFHHIGHDWATHIISTAGNYDTGDIVLKKKSGE